MGKKQTEIPAYERPLMASDEDFGDSLNPIPMAAKGQPLITGNGIKLKKAVVVDELFLKYEYSQDLPGHATLKSSSSCTIPIHQDLKDTFTALDAHLGLLCDQFTYGNLKSDNVPIEDFSCNQISIGGSGEKEGVTLTGSRQGKYGVVNLTTPFTVYESAADEPYPLLSELSEAVQAAAYEVMQYLFHGKRAPEKQLEIGFPQDDEENDEI